LNQPVILVHGGAGTHRSSSRAEKVVGVRTAADAGWECLAEGGSALDAVEAATRVLEDDPQFDAGRGSYLNLDGEVELDAIIMDGRRHDFGAVAAVPRVRHAITVARRVLEESPHALLSGRGAERFARQRGLTVPSAELIDPELLARWYYSHWRGEALAAAANPRASVAARPSDKPTGDTVGAVALDADGRMAAATSTGGTKNKWPGRIGDSPIVGSGAWAEDGVGAISSTGHGESIMRVCLAHRVSFHLAGGQTATEAAETGLAHLTKVTGGEAGMIVIDASGRLGWAWNSDAMPYAWRSTDDRGDGI
jgi:beta-aspartyl-peptidase (threonine type)